MAARSWTLFVGGIVALAVYRLTIALTADPIVRRAVAIGFVLRLALAVGFYLISFHHWPIFEQLQWKPGFWSFAPDSWFWDGTARGLLGLPMDVVDPRAGGAAATGHLAKLYRRRRGDLLADGRIRLERHADQRRPGFADDCARGGARGTPREPRRCPAGRLDARPLAVVPALVDPATEGLRGQLPASCSPSI